MKIDKIVKEIELRIEYLEKRKSGLIVLEITRIEYLKREDIINTELDKLNMMLHYSR